MNGRNSGTGSESRVAAFAILARACGDDHAWTNRTFWAPDDVTPTGRDTAMFTGMAVSRAARGTRSGVPRILGGVRVTSCAPPRR